MKYIEHVTDRTTQVVLPDDTFEQLQLAFYERLRKDRAGLAILGTALARAVTNPTPALEDLRTFAHRLRGAAAIFGAAEIRDAAQDLEVASYAAPNTLEDPANGAVWSAIALLADLLGSATEQATMSG
jgi:HPt (histidine-containing phosphotransfer) domain-containing protein